MDVPQEIVPVDLRVYDAVLLGRYPYIQGLGPSRRDQEIVSKVLDVLKLGELKDRKLTELSGGQLRKVAIARVLVQNTSLLLLDEPTSNLDLKTKMEVMDMLVRLVREEGRMAIVASHDLCIAARYADKLLMLKDGYVTAYGDVSILNEENISKTYGLRVKVLDFDGYPLIVPRGDQEPLYR
jgi:iron complex transport system ATP-binding protein